MNVIADIIKDEIRSLKKAVKASHVMAEAARKAGAPSLVEAALSNVAKYEADIKKLEVSLKAAGG